jgi:hypothetical protein
VRFFRKRIPPPMDPGLPPPRPEICIPFNICDAARVFLDQLAHAERIDEDIRLLISEWTLGYSDVLAVYIVETYGYDALGDADLITQGVQERFSDAVDETYKEAERKLFEQLESEFKDGDSHG